MTRLTFDLASGKTEAAVLLPEQLVGAAILSNGGFRTVLTNAFPDLQPYDESLELGRFVLLDEVPANAETWFLAEAFRQAAAQGVRGVVSFSDPVQRTTADGRVTMPGHIGLIYQASNATYTGQATPRSLHLLPDGTVFNAQEMQKIREQKQGHDYAERVLCSWGARPMRRRENPTAWLRDALRTAGTRTVRHPGNHRYLFALGDRRARRTTRLGFGQLPYPKATQRWRDHAHSWRPTSEGGFDSRKYEVAALDVPTAKAFVNQHHYAGSCTSVLQAYGLYAKS